MTNLTPKQEKFLDDCLNLINERINFYNKRKNDLTLEYMEELPYRRERFITSCKDGSAFGRILTDEEVSLKMQVWDEDAKRNSRMEKIHD